MAPKKTSKAAATSLKNISSQSEPASQDASQDTGVDYSQMNKLFIEQAKRKTAERRQERQTLVKANHDARVRKLREDVKTCFDSHDAKLRALRRPNIERLVKLTQKKRQIQLEIDKSQAELARAYEEASQQLQASIDGRVEDLT